jgi:hypothetical protein
VVVLGFAAQSLGRVNRPKGATREIIGQVLHFMDTKPVEKY